MKHSGIFKLICLLILAPLIIWQSGLKGTYRLYRQKEKIQLQNQQLPAPATARQQVYNPLLTEPLLSNGKILQLIADTLNAHQVEVVNYTPQLIDSEEPYKLYAGKLTLAGGFIDLVKVISQIEKATLPVKIASLTFMHDRTKRGAPQKVSLGVWMEQIEQTSSENLSP